MAFILDNSITMTWFMPDEANALAKALLDRVAREGAAVPSLWPIEIANTLTIAVRRRRISFEDRTNAVTLLLRLPIEVDDQTHNQAWGATLALADRFKLTLYDACYLELAQRMELPLATLDRELRAAGKAMKLKLLGA